MINVQRFVMLTLAVGVLHSGTACGRNTVGSADESLEKLLAISAASMGENVLAIQEGPEDTPGSRSADTVIVPPEDAEALLRECSAVRYASPSVEVSGEFSYKGRKYSEIVGAGPDYFRVLEWRIARGVAFTEADLRAHRRVCVLGVETARRLFGDEDAIGKSVSLVWLNHEDLNPLAFKVIGVLQEKGPGVDGSRSRDSIAVIPWTTAQNENRDGPRDALFCWGAVAKAVSKEKVPEAVRQIKAALRKRHQLKDGQPDDFVVKDQNEWIRKTVEWARRKPAPRALEPDALIRELLKSAPGSNGAPPRKGDGKR